MRAGSGTIGTGPGIDATLQLGDDLRRPREVDVLSFAATPPPRRTCARRHSPSSTETCGSRIGCARFPSKARALGGVSVEEDIRLAEYITTVEVVNLASPWLPVAYPAVAVNGLTGRWVAAAVQPHRAHPGGEHPGPALRDRHQRAATHSRADPRAPAGGTDQRDGHHVLAGRHLTHRRRACGRGHRPDHERLRRARRAPVLVPQFRVRLLARSARRRGVRRIGHRGGGEVPGGARGVLHPFRIGVRTHGTHPRDAESHRRRLPAGQRDKRLDRARDVYSVTSGQLHAWPEVFFEGIGWVPFEPTNGLGVPTDILTGRNHRGRRG